VSRRVPGQFRGPTLCLTLRCTNMVYQGLRFPPAANHRAVLQPSKAASRFSPPHIEVASAWMGCTRFCHSQVADLHAALSAFYPLVGPAASILWPVSLTQQQLLSGSKADLVHKLLLCLATHAEAYQDQKWRQQVAAAGVRRQQPDVQAQPEGVEDSSKQQAASTSSSSSSSETLEHQQAVAEQQRLQAQQQQQQERSEAENMSQQPEQQQQQQQVQEQQQPAGDAAGAPKLWLQQGPMVVPGTMPPYDPQEAASIAAAVGVELEDLPPLAQQSRGHVYDVDWLTEFNEQEKDLVLKVGHQIMQARIKQEGVITGGSAWWQAEPIGSSTRHVETNRLNRRGMCHSCCLSDSSPTCPPLLLCVQANRAGLVLTLVGGAVEGAESGDSSSSCLALLRERDAWLFDVGEDTQRLVMWLDHIRPSKVRAGGPLAGKAELGCCEVLVHPS